MFGFGIAGVCAASPLARDGQARRVARSRFTLRGSGFGSRGVVTHRSFDPVRVAQLECVVWVAYYRREWLSFLCSALFLTPGVFGLSWTSATRGSWFVLRATKLWAPYPDNDPNGARLAMERFYRILKKHTDEPFDPAEAARLEIRHYREVEGLSIAQIADRLGRSPATIKAYFYDPTGEKARAVKARYQGVCRGCGGCTQPRNGKGDVYAYCKACHPGAVNARWTRDRVLVAMRAWQAQ